MRRLSRIIYLLRNLCGFSFLVAALLLNGTAAAQESHNINRGEFLCSDGYIKLANRDYSGAYERFRGAIEIIPNMAKAHIGFVETSNRRERILSTTHPIFNFYNVECIGDWSEPGWYFGRGLCYMRLAENNPEESYFISSAGKDFKRVYISYEESSLKDLNTLWDMLERINGFRENVATLAKILPPPRKHLRHRIYEVLRDIIEFMFYYWWISILLLVVIIVSVFAFFKRHSLIPFVKVRILDRKPTEEKVPSGKKKSYMEVFSTKIGSFKDSICNKVATIPKAVSRRICPHCRVLVEKKALVCPNCHKPIRCPYCHRIMEKDTVRCVHCGRSVAPPIKCPHCTEENSSESLECIKCGFKLKEGCNNCHGYVEFFQTRCGFCGHDTQRAKYRKERYSLHCTHCDHELKDSKSTICDACGKSLAGGYAKVERAVHRDTGQTYAFKTLREEHVNNENAINHFEHGAAVLMMMNHQRIVKAHAYIKNGGSPYYVMDYLPGETLDDYLKRVKVLRWMEAIDIFLDIAEAVSHLHYNKIIHRDLKPSNLRAKEKGETNFIIIDFDTVFNPDLKITKLGSSGGNTEIYAAPEQLANGPTDEKSDIYTLGIILFEMINGLFTEEKGPPLTLPQKVAGYSKIGDMKVPAIPVGEGLGYAPKEVSEVIAKAMNFDPVERYATVEEFREALKGARRIRTYGH